MNQTIAKFARDHIKANLAQCSEGERGIFMKMYAYGRPDLSVIQAVDAMPDERLDWALTQTENTLKKKARQAAEASP